ncbi:MAG TPA: type IV secretion protein IcmB [Rhodospirillaceae bacterium]|nr:MAG: type IV secretion protein IcmB [Alphaproteobacteria bacterium GWF2_58_20]HAU29963.1 type IV secretion protein IcmB [Rhodospirillaceae bacterium]
MARLIDDILGSFFAAMHQPVESYVRLETADDSQTLVAGDGSLLTILKIHGARQIIGDEEYRFIVEQASVKLGARFDRPGHAMQVYFSRDPERMVREIGDMVRPSELTSRAIGLDLADLFEERRRNLSRYLAWEDIYFVLWTRPVAMTDVERKNEEQKRRARPWVVAPTAQYPFAALESLRSRHGSYVSSIASSLEEIGIQSSVVEVHEALSAVRTSIYPNLANDRWRPCLPGDPIPVRALQSRSDLSDVLWPALRRQLCVGDAEVKTQNSVRIGNQIWSGVDMTLAPMEPSPFPVFLGRLVEAGIPFRISFLIEAGGASALGFKKAVASILGFSNDVNKQIKDSLEGIEALARDEAVVKLRISMATWAPPDQPKLLEERTSMLVQAFEGWGYCQVSQIAGDPLDCVMSSALGIACASTAPAAIAPFYDVLKLLPWQRASSPFDKGSVLLRSPDGRVWPYQTGTNLTTTWFDLIFAQPGAGKSVLMNALNLGTCLTPGLSQLPYVAIIDIGPSSAGLVSLLKDAMPPERRHEVAHYRLRMTPEYAINPFDTQLGSRYPLPDERSYLVELLTLLCTPPGQPVPYDGIPQLCGLVVDEMFRWRDDVTANAEAHPYLQRIDEEVDKAISDRNIHLPTEATWWDVVDGLFEAGDTHAAMLAQRYAVPTLTDAVTASRRPQIRALLEETKISAGAESVIGAFERMIASSIREFALLASVTKFDIGDARVCALDLGEVAPQGDETSDRQTAILYMLARHALVRHWWLGEDALKNLNPKYREHHELRLRSIRESPKRLCYDEFHRTSKSRSVRAQVVRDVREGRKWGVQIVLASQLLEDFDDNMIDLATGVWILGAAISERSVDQAAKRFGLSDTARWYMRYRLTGPRSSGAPALMVLGTNEGRYEQFLINTLGPIELWALSTSSEDVSIRTRVYHRLGAKLGREILATNYPGGSARSEIRRRVTQLSEKGEVESAATSVVIEDIVNELVQAAVAAQRLQLS